MARWGDEIGVDLGTAHTQICVKGEGIVVREPSVIAYSGSKRRPVAIGEEAALLEAKRLPGVRVVRPLMGGVVADFDAAVDLARQCIRAALGRRPLVAPLVIGATTTETTPVERRALVDCLRAAGGGKVYLVPKCLAAGLGSEVPVDDTETRLVMDLGAGTTDIGLVSMGAVAKAMSLHYAGNDLDEALVRWVKHRVGVLISRWTAEQIKVRVSAVAEGLARKGGGLADLAGNNGHILAEELPLHEVPRVLRKAVAPIAGELRWMLSNLSPELRAEVHAGGMVLTGGTALLRGLAPLMEESVGLRATVARDPLSCTIIGLETILNNLRELYSRVRTYADMLTSPES